MKPERWKRSCHISGSIRSGVIQRIANGEFREVKDSRRGNVYLIEAAKSYIAHTNKESGNKGLVADVLKEGHQYWAHDAVAMNVNDMVTTGALPLSLITQVSVDNEAWFEDEDRALNLLHGFTCACEKAGCAWGGSEVSVRSGPAIISASAMGFVKPKETLLHPGRIHMGDDIVLIESSGLHACGVLRSLRLADELPRGYYTPIGDGPIGDRTYGEALLHPAHIYVTLMEQCVKNDYVHCAMNVGDHGWPALLSELPCFEYRLHRLFEPSPLFLFIQQALNSSLEDMYCYFNMGVGLVLFVPGGSVGEVLSIAHSLGLPAIHAGSVWRNLQQNERRLNLLPAEIDWRQAL